ncbi:hypothetical protein Aab01nite_80650 [Paractinoplanes abujensis]|uniref:Uncharacterized protein n=1 Tax=Paractinoplanes abujensis TaxID=882441 RepID=A0A7W7CTW3_9ACTN|nr:hypothetical protein [Actinoplanes abujensis]MBB4693275.1 hypothetical protein [Actinoplanes abujensis]GID24475.1 hypothetical protein Aab01nite_80650 [Actinoplanes abujensis]
MLLSDRLVLERQPVPGRLLPPPRAREVVRGYAYRVTFCDHEQLAVLRDFVAALEVAEPEQPAAPPGDRPIVAGLLRNRGFGLYELPFLGLSRSTVNKMMRSDRNWPTLRHLKPVADFLDWPLAELAAVGEVPMAPIDDPVFSSVCRHVGAIYAAAALLTTEQLVRVGAEADRLSARIDHGVWQPFAMVTRDCVA